MEISRPEVSKSQIPGYVNAMDDLVCMEIGFNLHLFSLYFVLVSHSFCVLRTRMGQYFEIFIVWYYLLAGVFCIRSSADCKFVICCYYYYNEIGDLHLRLCVFLSFGVLIEERLQKPTNVEVLGVRGIPALMFFQDAQPRRKQPDENRKLVVHHAAVFGSPLHFYVPVC